MPVHVSLHDVSPACSREVELALSLAHEVGVKPSLLVVPNFHAKAPLGDAPAFVDRLRALERDGHEILLHGYYHLSGVAPLVLGGGGRPAPSGLRRLYAQHVVSGSEAEFSDVGEAEARRRIEDGLRVLADAKLSPVGFVPPAWSMPPWMLDVLASFGLRFTEDHVRVVDPTSRASRRTLVLNYASRTPGRLATSVLGVRALSPLERLLPARLAMHPADMGFSLLRSETKTALAWARSRGFLPTVRSLF